MLLACVRIRPALRNLLERDDGAKLPRIVKPRDLAAQDAQATFVLVAESAAAARDWSAACRIMDPVCVYLRLFDGQSCCLSLVLPATLKLQAEMAALEGNLCGGGVAGTVSSAVFSQACAVMNKRVAGPSDRSMRVLLLTDLHLLAGALDPKVLDAQGGNWPTSSSGLAGRSASTF